MGESGTVNEVCEALDPKFEMIQGRFGRENTILKNGKYIKDLSYMNRPAKDIIYVDFSDEFVDFHKENAIILKKFEGEHEDRDLIDLIPFLDRKFFYELNFNFLKS
jgi:import inner membrane translocase subunit TIM50